jgi:hypothetical protein
MYRPEQFQRDSEFANDLNAFVKNAEIDEKNLLPSEIMVKGDKDYYQLLEDGEWPSLVEKIMSFLDEAKTKQDWEQRLKIAGEYVSLLAGGYDGGAAAQNHLLTNLLERTVKFEGE